MKNFWIVALLMGQSVFAGETLINKLRLDGNANGARADFTNLNSVVSSNVTANTVAAGSIVASNILMTGSSTSLASAVTIGYIGNTTLGSEGIRKIGALGGYTLEEFIEDTATRGLARDLPIFSYNATNLTVSYSEGDVYEPSIGYFHLDPGTRNLTDNASNYAYWSTNDTTLIQWTTGSRPRAEGNIYLATFMTSMGKIIHVGTGIAVGDELLSEDVAFANIMPSIITEGLVVYPTGTDLTNIVSDSGVEYHNMADRIDHGKVDFSVSNSLAYYGHVGGVWTRIVTNKFPVGLWDDGTNIVSGSVSNWYRGVFVSIAGSGQLTWITPDRSYTNDTEAIAGNDPDLPPGFTPYIPLTTAYVFKGDDTSLRTDLTYWLDRRFMIRRGAITSGGGGGGNTPTLEQVLQAGAGTGGILPSGMGNPVTDDQGASKGYVDSTRNKASTGTAYVDPVNGDDVTGRIEKGSLPFKTIQAAINACAVVATDARRFLVTASIGMYNEDVTMANFISLRGMDIESTIIQGQIYYPPTYIDTVGGEIQVLSVFTTNRPAVYYNAGDDAYSGARSCAFYSIWTQDDPMKFAIKIARGQFQMYATCWAEIDVYPDAGYGASNSLAYVYYCTTNVANLGTFYLDDFSGSHIIRCTDTNDTVGLIYADANQDSSSKFHSCQTDFYLDDSDLHANTIRIINHQGANCSSDSVGDISDVRLNETNNVVLIAATSQGSPAFRKGSGVHYNGNRIRIPNIQSNNNYYASSTGTNDYVEVFNTQLGPQTSAYPARYTADGSLGIAAFTINHASGDLLIGGGIDMSAGQPTGFTPLSGHLNLYAYTYAGFENPYFVDSSGNKIRLARDSFFNGFNTEGMALQVGETVYVTNGLSAQNTPQVARAFAGDATKMPCAGIVVQPGGIAAGAIGRIMRAGRTEEYFNTSAFTPGDKLYVSGTIPGGITNISPTGSNISQQVGWCHIANTNGYANVYLWTPDTLGGRVPQDYMTYDSPTFSDSTNRITIIEARTSAWNRVINDLVNATNILYAVDTNLQAQIVVITNRVKAIEDQTNNWNASSTPSRKFLANVGVTANQTFANATAQVLYTNVVFNYGGTYSNSATIARWIPGVSNVMVSIQGSMRIDVNNQPVIFSIKLYKDGVLKSTMFNRRMQNDNDDLANTFSYVDITTSATNYYEVFVTSDKAAQVMLGSGADNWWSGQIIY